MQRHKSGDYAVQLLRLVSAHRTNASLQRIVVLALALAATVTGMLTLGSVRLHAQLSAATLNGTVVDSSGAAVPGATVTILPTRRKMQCAPRKPMM